MKFRRVRRKLTAPSPRILDIGCGNGSPTVTKRWFPGCHYAGADIQRYKLSNADVAAMDVFFPLNIDGSGYDAIPDASYDFVILNHVVEHMRDPAPVVATLCAKLKPGGYIWIAFPSLRSLSLPHSVDETLNFFATTPRMCTCRMCARWRMFCWRTELRYCTRAVRARVFGPQLPTC